MDSKYLFSPALIVVKPELEREGLVVRPLCIDDLLNKGFPQVLSNLTEVGNPTKEQLEKKI